MHLARGLIRAMQESLRSEYAKNKMYKTEVAKHHTESDT